MSLFFLPSLDHVIFLMRKNKRTFCTMQSARQVTVSRYQEHLVITAFVTFAKGPWDVVVSTDYFSRVSSLDLKWGKNKVKMV